MANKALVSMLGYTSFEELTGQNLDEQGCGPIYQREAFRAQIERDGETRGVESVWKRRDNSVLFVRENAKVVRDANGKILYFEGTVEDITERKAGGRKASAVRGAATLAHRQCSHTAFTSAIRARTAFWT